MDKLKVAFICVHNSCRSQIAEALGKTINNREGVFMSKEGTVSISFFEKYLNLLVVS